MPYSSKECIFEHEVIEAVTNTAYQRLTEGRSIVIYLGGIHNIVVSNDVDSPEKVSFDLDGWSPNTADGTGHKRQTDKLP